MSTRRLLSSKVSTVSTKTKKESQGPGLNPVLTLGLALCVTLALTYGYKWYVQPKIERKRYLEREEMANFIFEQEMNRKNAQNID